MFGLALLGATGLSIGERNPAMASVDAVADYVLTKIDTGAGDAITHLKLQKIVYYCQAWSLALRGATLFGDDILAWAHGPVVYSLWTRFKGAGWQALDPTEMKTDPYASLSDAERELVDQVRESYGDFSGAELRTLTHSEDPWKSTYGDRPAGSTCFEVIPVPLMREFYAGLEGS